MIFPVVSGSSGIEIDGIRVAVGTPSCPELVPQLYCKFDDYWMKGKSDWGINVK